MVHEQLLSKRIPQFIKNHLGERAENSHYSYSDLLLNMTYTTFCGGECAEDLNYVSDTFRHLKGLKVPSPDTLLKMQKELSTPTEQIESSSGVINKININEKLNSLLVKTAVYTGVLKTDQEYCMDFDNQFIPTEKYDAVYSYKKQKGYFPSVASINNTPVYIEGRNGNSSVTFNQLNTFKRCFAQLEADNISVSRVRMDSGSYIKEVCNWLSKEKSVKFDVRAEQSTKILSAAADCFKWKNIQVGVLNYQAASFDYKFGNETYRVVAYRMPNKTGQLSLITSDANRYLFIITNDRDLDEKSIIEFYNHRGAAEKLFDIQNNDFNWKKLPFGDLHHNTVYLILTAISNVLYQWIIGIFCKVYDFLKPATRLKRFTFRLICMAAKVTRSGRRKVVRIFSRRLPSYLNSS